MFSQLTDLDLRLIRVFLAIVDAGGVSPAQATLNVGQSTISTQLATLETRLGYRLCERGRGGFSLAHAAKRQGTDGGKPAGDEAGAAQERTAIEARGLRTQRRGQ